MTGIPTTIPRTSLQTRQSGCLRCHVGARRTGVPPVTLSMAFRHRALLHDAYRLNPPDACIGFPLYLTPDLNS